MSLFERQKALTLGKRGEKAAVLYLKKQGYKILESNFFNVSGRRMGEIDIVAKDGEELVFVEVKTRTAFSKNDSPPEESITRNKLYKLNKAASFYLSKNQTLASPYRFDAITLVVDPENKCGSLKHIKNIFI
jgi:putative endonuclease